MCFDLMGEPILPDKLVRNTRSQHQVMRRYGPEAARNGEDYIYPVDWKAQWIRDFYDLMWKNYLRAKLLLVVHLFDTETQTAKATTSMQLTNEDGKIKYGDHILDFYQSPLADLEVLEESK